MDAAYAALSAGAADAMASDEHPALPAWSRPSRTGINSRSSAITFTYEPYAIMFRKDDPDLADLVRASFEGMAASSRLATNYRKWFQNPLPDGRNLDLAMSAHLTEL